MTVETKGDLLVLLDLPQDFTLPERFPVIWNPQLQAFSISRRAASVPALLRILQERGLLPENWQGGVRGMRGGALR